MKNLFAQYRAIYATQKEVLAWAHRQEITPGDILFIYPWTVVNLNSKKRLIVVFGEHENIWSDHHCIFSIPRISLYEHTNEKSLRHGLTTDQMSALFAFARACLGNELNGGIETEVHEEELNVIPTALRQEQCEVDVAVYMKGRMRGSMVVSGLSLIECIKKAAQKIPHDARFKPITQAEFASATIEITIAPDLGLVLRAEDYKCERSFYTKMYKVKVGNVTRSWFTPSVCSSGGHETLTTIVSNLGAGKSALTADEQKRATYVVSETISGFEGAHGVVKSEGVFPVMKLLTDEMLTDFTRSLVLSAVDAIDADGFATIRNTVDGNMDTKLDAGRLAFLWLTLTEYQERCGSDESITSACDRLFSFLLSIRMDVHPLQREIIDVYTRCRLHRDAQIVFAEQINKKNVLLELQKIRAYQLLPVTSCSNDTDISEKIYLAYQLWHEHKNELQLAAYADLAPALYDIGDLEKVDQLVHWYGQQQLANGGFLSRPRSNSVYTRGASKVAESLALIPSAQTMVHKNLSWLKTMQYTPSTLYYIPIEKHSRFINGIRHDYWNQSVWLDSACHTLLAAIRYTDVQRSNTPR